MPNCDKCHKETKETKETKVFFRLGKDRYCEPCYGPRKIRPFGFSYTTPSNFEPHFDPTIKQYVSSYSDKEKKGKAFRNEKHPNGFVMYDDNKKLIKECKDDLKNREEVIEKIYATKGIKYPKGQNVRWSDSKNCFVHNGTDVPYNRKVYI